MGFTGGLFKQHLEKIWKSRSQISFWVLLSFVTGSLLLTANSSVFASPDDFCTYSTRFYSDGCMSTGDLTHTSIIQAAISQAESQGRFYQILYYTLTQFAFFYSPEVTIYIIRIVTLAIFFHALFAFTAKIAPRKLAGWAPIAFAGTYSVATGYNALTGFPLWFLLGQTLLFYAFTVFDRLFERGSLWDYLRFSLLFLTGISSYEAIIFEIPGLVALVLIKRTFKHNISPTLFSSIRPMSAIGLMLALYLGTYWVFGVFSPSTYNGTSISLDEPQEILKTVGLFSVGHLLDSIEINVHLSNFESYPFVFIFVFAIVFALISTIIKAKSKASDSLISMASILENSKIRNDLALALVALACSFMPNLPLALTSRYRMWAAGEPLYLGTFYSACLQAIFLVFVCSVIFKLAQRSVFKTIAAASVAGVITITIVSNVALFQGQNYANWVYAAVTQAVSDEIRHTPISPNSVVSYEDIESYLGTGSYRFWDAYIFEKTGVRFRDNRFLETDARLDTHFKFVLDADGKKIELARLSE